MILTHETSTWLCRRFLLAVAAFSCTLRDKQTRGFDARCGTILLRNCAPGSSAVAEKRRDAARYLEINGFTHQSRRKLANCRA